MLIADHFPKLARGQRRDRESDPEPEKSPPPAPGPVTGSSEPAPRTLRPGRKLWVGTESARPRPVAHSPHQVAAGTWGSVPGASSRGRALRDRWPTLRVEPRGAPSGTHSWDRWSTSSRIPRSNWPTLWARSPSLPTGARGGLSHECAGSAWLGGASGGPPEAGDANCSPAGAKRAPGPTLVPIWFPHWPAWMCTISLMAGASALGRCLSRLRRDCGWPRAPGT